MKVLVAWIATGLATVLLGVLAVQPELDDPVLNLIGWSLLVLGSIATQVGVIGLGVLLALGQSRGH